MSKNTVVIYHGNCDDGFGAAYAAWKFFGDKAEYIPGEYGLTKEFPFDKIDIDGKDVIILDFSYDKKSMEELQRRAKYVRLIDHHKSAYDSLGEMSCCEFDLSHSGAYLAWKIWLILTLLLFLEIEVLIDKRNLKNGFDNELARLSDGEKILINILNSGVIRITSSNPGSQNHENLERLRRKKIIKAPRAGTYQEKVGGITGEKQGLYCEFTEEYLNYIRKNKK